MIIITDRSRIETYHKCPRARWWGYEYGNRGLQRISLSLDLHIGICTHDILHDIMEMAKAHNFTDTALDTAIATHLATFESAIRTRGLALELDSGYEQQADGSIAVNSGLLDLYIAVYSSWIRQSTTAWTAVRLPRLLEEYEIVETEHEEELLLGNGSIMLLGRLDALLRRKLDGQLFVLNFKTVGEPNEWWREQWPLDMQLISEPLEVEARLGQPIAGVLIEGLVKGGKRLQYPPDSGNWWINSPLIWMWKKDAAAPFPAEYAAKFEWTGDDGKNHRLGKGWHKQPAWSDSNMSLREWLNWLYEHEFDLLQSQFVSLPPILINREACKEWQSAVEFQEDWIYNKRLFVEQQLDGHYVLNYAFPMHTGSGNCIRPSKCEFYNLCHGSAAADPLNSGYQWRVPNHPRELELVQIQEVS